jgi:hypothetical protein
MSDDLKYQINELECFHVEPSSPEGTWKELQRKCGFLSNWGVEKLREGLDGFVQTIVLEPYYTCKDHRNLHSNFYSKKFLEITSNCQRLHFFSQDNLRPKELLANPDKFQTNYLGFSVIRPVNTRCLGRTVIDPYKIGKSLGDGFYLLRTRFRAQINGTEFSVLGYPFTTQDTDATLCAHSALWGVCRYLSERYPHYKELYPFDFIKMTESSKGRAFPYRGMTYTDYCKILTDFGTFPVTGVLQKKGPGDKVIQDIDAFNDMCAYVESGFPVLASLRLQNVGHVISLIGHTLDYAAPISERNGFVESSRFLKQFIVVDDNHFPYEKLGSDGDPENYAAQYGPSPMTGGKLNLKDIITMTCPLPEKVFLPARNAREKAMKHCQKFLSILKQTGTEPFVTRLFVTSSSAFKKRKLAAAKSGNDPASSLVASLHLPHFVWVMEISSVEPYKKGICKAEVVLDATAGSAEDGIIYMRVGDQMHFAGRNKTVWKRIAGPDQFIQYTHNLGEKAEDRAGKDI